jgi:hypothetical protein
VPLAALVVAGLFQHVVEPGEVQLAQVGEEHPLLGDQRAVPLVEVGQKGMLVVVLDRLTTAGEDLAKILCLGIAETLPADGSDGGPLGLSTPRNGQPRHQYSTPRPRCGSRRGGALVS